MTVQIVLDFDEDSFDFLDQHDDEVTDEPWSDEFLHEGSALFDLAGSTQQLIFPDDGAGEPQLSIQDMIQLDSLADRVEIERLTKLGVLLPPDSLQCEPGQHPKTLSTRFVRTWREKVIDNKRVFLRRSRYVAREFAWLDQRQDLYSPASSNVTNRLFPILFLMLRSMDFVLSALDVSDAFLTVVQNNQPEMFTSMLWVACYLDSAMAANGGMKP